MAGDPAAVGAAPDDALGRDLMRSRRYEVLIIDAELIAGALEWMERYRDKRLSLTDCASFEVMERLDIGAAFTFDPDFRDCGWKMVPSDE